MKRLMITIFCVLPLFGQAQININKVKNKVKSSTTKNSSNKSNSESTEKKEETTNSNTSTTNSNTSTTNSNENKTNSSTAPATNNIAAAANFYDGMRQYIDRNLPNIGNRKWDDDFMDYIETADIARLEKRMEEDVAAKDFLMLYPKKLPTSGMGTITQGNLGEFSFANIADTNAEPPASEDGKKIMKFYIEYCWFKYELKTGSKNIATMIQKGIQEAEGAHIRQKFNLAKLVKRQASLAHELLPDDMRIEDLKSEADATYNKVIEGFGLMISSPYHREHIQDIVVLKNKPSFKSETAADEIETIIPGESAFVTGYFAMTNKDAGGIPSLLFINPENKYAKDKNPWGHGVEVIASMFNGKSVKDEFYDKAYFTFNLFPDLNTINYESHVQYFPHLNICKWLMYLPSEVVEIPVRFGRMEKVALGKLKIDLSGDNKTKLKTYFAGLEEKRIAAARMPDFAGCTDMRSKVKNFADLAKYGEVLLLTLSQTGDIMKPWPNDHEVDFNTAAGYASVKKASGKVEVMPLEFRKRPTESIWQWWSVGSFPGLFPMDEQGTKIVGVKKLEHGYEILPENAKKCGYWYDQQ